MIVRPGAASLLALWLLAAAMSASVQAQETVHGANSLFVSATVKIAWAAHKGAIEEATTVVIRVVNSADAYRQIRLDGVDPFSKQRKVLVAPQALASQVDLSVARALFAEFPSCEIHLFKSDAPPADAPPSLTVYYLGVPDTTPEFASMQAVDEYLAKMLEAAK
jgi:hypothetical protein